MAQKSRGLPSQYSLLLIEPYSGKSVRFGAGTVLQLQIPIVVNIRADVRAAAMVTTNHQ